MSDPVTRLNAALSGRYVIDRELGEGGMATVYLADDTSSTSAAVHPLNGDSGETRGRPSKLRSEFYLMCDDVASVISSLQAKGIECSEINGTGWGMLTSVRLPSGGEVGLYEPKHPTALKLE